jgi:hypothetical protein
VRGGLGDGISSVLEKYYKWSLRWLPRDGETSGVDLQVYK